MVSLQSDQAEGLRRMMASQQPRIISILSVLGPAARSNNEYRMLADLAASFTQDGANTHIIYGVDDDQDVLKYYGLLQKPSLIDLMQAQRPLIDGISNIRDGFTSSWLGNMDVMSALMTSHLSDYILALAEAHEVVLVDTKINPQQGLPLPLLNDAAIVIQMNEKSTSVKLAYSLIKQLHHKIGKREFAILVHGRTAKHADQVFTKIAAVAKRFLGVTLEYGGYLPCNLHADRVDNTGRNVMQAKPNIGIANIYHEVTKRLLRQPPAFAAFDLNPMI